MCAMIFRAVNFSGSFPSISLSFACSSKKVCWTSLYSSCAWWLLVKYTARKKVWLVSSRMYAKALSYWTFTFSCFRSFSASSGTSAMPSSSRAICSISFFSSAPLANGLSARIGRQRLFTFMVFCSSIFNEASPRNSADGLKSLLIVCVTSSLPPVIRSLGCSITSGSRCK